MPVASAYAAGGSLFPRAVQVRPPADASTSTFSSSLFATYCTGSRDCVAGGSYTDSHGRNQGFVATESHGAWSRGSKVLLPPSAAAQPNASVNGLTCTSARNCAAVGSFAHNASNDDWALVAKEVNGKWGRAFVPRPPANANGVVSYLDAVACTPTGFCAAVGGYTDTAGHFQAMALTKPAAKSWQRAVEIKMPAGSAANPYGTPNGVACTAVGKCVTAGSYRAGGSGTPLQAMGAILSGGRWHNAVRITPPANALHGSFAYLDAVTCRSGKCIAVGGYYFGTNAFRAMWVPESNGHFRSGKEIIKAPANAAPVANTTLYGISCPSSGPCVAAGNYDNTAGHQFAMYMTLSSGKWTASALRPPLGASAGSFERSLANAVSCTGTEHCTIVGWYNDTAGRTRSEAASTG